MVVADHVITRECSREVLGTNRAVKFTDFFTYNTTLHPSGHTGQINMSNTVEGIVRMYPPQESGQGKENVWYKQKMIVETYGQYPKKVAVTFMNEKIGQLQQFPIGSAVKVSVNLESREYNGNWYDSINGWKVEHGAAATAGAPVGAPLQHTVDHLQAAAAQAQGYPQAQQPVVQQQQPVSQAQQPVQYQIGQIVNGHRFTGTSWEPVQPVAPVQTAPPAQQIPQPPAPQQIVGAPSQDWNSQALPF